MDKNDYTQDTKPTLLDKIKSIFKPNQKALPGSDFVPLKKTNMSFGTWDLMYNIRSTISDTLNRVSSGISNLMKPKEPKITNGFQTIEYSNETPNTLKEYDSERSEDSGEIRNIIIAGSKSRDKSSIAVDTLKVENLSIDKDVTLKKDSKEPALESHNKSDSHTSQNGIETGTIGEVTKESKEEIDYGEK